jgi:glutathione reductase (NADPH)
MYDTIIIGSGSAGQTVAGDLVAAGKKVAIVEKRETGGTCALRGCEPKKVLYSAVEVVERFNDQSGKGIQGSLEIDWPDLMKFKRTFTDPVSAGVENWFQTSGMDLLRGAAVFVDEQTLLVGGQTFGAAHFVIASGAKPVPLNIPGEEMVLSSEDFLAAEFLPKRIVFIGGGYISFEFAHIAAVAGAQVTILQRGERALVGFDPQLVDRVVAHYHHMGIQIKLGATVSAVNRREEGLRVLLEDGFSVDTDWVIHAAGRMPDIDTLHLEKAGISFGRGDVRVNPYLQSTSHPRVWAGGDAAEAGLPLTPVGVIQGHIVAHNILNGNQRTFEPKVSPSVVFSSPPLAKAGLTEQEARQNGKDFRVNFVDTTKWASSRRVALPVSAAKVLIENGTNQILGAHLLGHHAEEVINVFAAAMAGGLTAEDIQAIPWAYPTSGSDIVYLV